MRLGVMFVVGGCVCGGVREDWCGGVGICGMWFEHGCLYLGLVGTCVNMCFNFVLYCIFCALYCCF